MNNDDFARVINWKSVWSHLVVAHEGTLQVKRVKIDLLHSQYENFSINENEFIDDMILKFTKITNRLASLGDAIDNDQKVRKVIVLFHHLRRLSKLH